MKNKVIISTILFAIVLTASFVMLIKERNYKLANGNTSVEQPLDQNQAILFYGETCPHCKVVEQYITENNLQDKNLFVEREVSKNRDNAKLLQEKAVICGINTNSIGIPFFWDGEKCFEGQDEIINYLKQKNNVQ
ncbi:MAG: hypothetical protein WCX88_02275 [Patescibacteria group bacterium]